jgi:hypothetical protein
LLRDYRREHPQIAYDTNSDFYEFDLLRDYRREHPQIAYDTNSDFCEFDLLRDSKRATQLIEPSITGRAHNLLEGTEARMALKAPKRELGRRSV